MKNCTDLKTLRDIKTTISVHARSTSRNKGTPYLEIASMGFERLRLETALAHLYRNKERIENRLKEINHVLTDRLVTVQDEILAGNGSQPAPHGLLGSEPTQRAAKPGSEKKARPGPAVPEAGDWNTLTVEY